MRQLSALFAAFLWLLTTSMADAAPGPVTWNCHLTFVLASGRRPLAGNSTIGGPGMLKCADDQGSHLKTPVWLTVEVDILSPKTPARSFNIQGTAEPIRISGSPSRLLGRYTVASSSRLVIAGTANTPVTLLGGDGQPTWHTRLTVNGSPGTKLSLGTVLIKRESWR